MTRDALSLKFYLYSLRRVPVTQQRHNGTGWHLPYGGYPPESPGSGRPDMPPWPPWCRGYAAELVSLRHGSNADAPRDLLRYCRRLRGYRWWSVPVFSSALRCSAERHSWQLQRSGCDLRGFLRWSASWFLSLPWSF